MKNLKLILPMLAFIMAIGMAFAFNNSKAESKSAVLNVYHYDGLDANGDIIFSPGEPDPNACSSGETPCRFESEQPLVSPMSSSDIQNQAEVTAWRE